MSNSMTALLRSCGLFAVVALTALPVAAQTPTDSSADDHRVPLWTGRAFAHVSVGAQPTGRTYVSAGSFDLYDEPATFDASVSTGSAAMIDLTGGIGLWENFAGVMSYTYYSDKAGAEVNSNIPHPLFANTYASGTVSVSDLRHREQSVHLAVAYILPRPDLWNVQVMLFAGPSIISLNKSVIRDITVQDGTQTVQRANTQDVSATTLGAHFGFDVKYPITDRIGAGFLLRWAQGTADVPQVQGGKVKVGGLQFGAGLRYEF
jgi:hypothetical protein